MPRVGKLSLELFSPETGGDIENRDIENREGENREGELIQKISKDPLTEGMTPAYLKELARRIQTLDTSLGETSTSLGEISQEEKTQKIQKILKSLAVQREIATP